jgi:hypothetical protein
MAVNVLRYTRYVLNDPGFERWRGRFSKTHPNQRPTQPTVKWVQSPLSRGTRPEYSAVHLPHSSDGVTARHVMGQFEF